MVARALVVGAETSAQQMDDQARPPWIVMRSAARDVANDLLDLLDRLLPQLVEHITVGNSLGFQPIHAECCILNT